MLILHYYAHLRVQSYLIVKSVQTLTSKTLSPKLLANKQNWLGPEIEINSKGFNVFEPSVNMLYSS